MNQISFRQTDYLAGIAVVWAAFGSGSAAADQLSGTGRVSCSKDDRGSCDLGTGELDGSARHQSLVCRHCESPDEC